LAKPGIAFVDFGSQDLGHDLLVQKHPGFETIDDCLDFVKNALQGTGVRFAL
jgi:hypothetical protein